MKDMFRGLLEGPCRVHIRKGSITVIIFGSVDERKQ